MPLRVLKSSEGSFERDFSDLERRRQAGQGLEGAGADSLRRSVEEIIQAVRERGDEAVLQYTERFDGCRLTQERMRVSENEIDEAVRAVPAELADALKTAAGRIREFQEAILLRDPKPVKDGGRKLALRYMPVESTGICVPGATASLASSVLMNVVPAAVAGVRRIAMVTPPGRDGSVSADRLAAARIAGASEVYRIGGVQAVAALAFGTQTIPRVDFIGGPGNAYVTAAKKAVFGQVGIDMLAGPSEIVVIADAGARADWVAAELLSQAEHAGGSATLLTSDAKLAEAVARAVEEQLQSFPAAAELRRGLEELSAIVVARSIQECVELSDRIAPEHLVIMTEDPEAVCERVKSAGAIFLGALSPVAVGDYVAGPSHCLPTGRTARFASGLTANSFLRSSSVICYDMKSLRQDAKVVYRIAEAEGLEAHRRSVQRRLEGP